MTDFDHNEYKIGDRVRVYRRVTAWKDDHTHRVARTDILRRPTAGTVVGVQIRHEGTVTHGSHDGLDGWEPGFLTHTKTVRLWLVRLGLTNKPVEVFRGDMMRLTDLEEKIEPPLPIKWTNPLEWTEEDRERIREYARDYPRDAKGRWAKGA